ncbi:MAG: hypothetical protein UR29_C0013G0020 [Candidatus Woesebacteria bacterium GW2011_GWC2_33_12]|uniref:DUF3850 domain-containing protein n=1 Tax=Candidatus Woesebacteria bacterium GW2011_GWB1_33_22 TaxID=1618566 RepID=A0A0F9ZIZ5_9BACT|nr:MAG: hypothetical protein UR29_C0013G0020 [Candidatus Woesebacteria bacterium GW2011_GWC2_33_12]KKP41706.1 MAG: hypothetical protein UR33_C0011G0021 [Candidatus Woesebacteria bacterium GW2011_GWA2_33_20]KKP44158.1 MAG: hypothetical protein UR35_C0011G0044 [Candidatus Woesebacteria bacterium GW2011_GWB1_33_22]KKP45817.1 MAG: hypothetical protein UR37_C0014G0044 [Microgenomates group bacterium GW2011_GWC1_33_28]KKP50239.1 MAG: hypothetical protein UR41_C0010G0043 [Candidatus Woesebacteria bact
MTRIEKKTWPELFNKILSGEKTFDVRIADFKIKVKDVLVLREYDPVKKSYTGRKIEKKITFVLNSKDQKFWPKKDINKFGLAIMGFKSLQKI